MVLLHECFGEIGNHFEIAEESIGTHDSRLQELQSLIDVLTTNVGDLMNRIHHISSPVQTQHVRAGMSNELSPLQSQATQQAEQPRPASPMPTGPQPPGFQPQ